MPAPLSSPIFALVDQLDGLDVADPVQIAPCLRQVLERVADPRARRGVRHGLVTVLVAAVCAVAAGACSFVAIAEWVAELPVEVAATLGVSQRCPCESTIRRIVQCMDGDRFDVAIGAWIQDLCTAGAQSGRRRAVAVDGKAVRGSRDRDGRAQHLIAVIDHQVRVVLGQVDVQGKTNEITRFAPLLDTLDLTDVVVTADALHTQREHVDYLASRGAHWVLTVKGNQPNLRTQLAAMPWRDVDPGHRVAENSHARREIRTLKVVTLAEGIMFPHATQAIQLTRRTRPLSGRGRWHIETVYAITDLDAYQARPGEIAAWMRGHWQIENSLHWVRDVTFGEDLSQVRTGAAPQIMASLRNLVISLHRLAGATNIAAALRHHARDAHRTLKQLMIN